MERPNHSSSTTWRRQLRREPFLSRGGCAICSGALAHWGRGDAPPPRLSVQVAPTQHPVHTFLAQTDLLFSASSLYFGPHPQKTRKIHSLWTLASRQRTYREDPGVVSLSLLTQSFPKHREAHRAFGARPAAPRTTAFCAARRRDAVILSHPR